MTVFFFFRFRKQHDANEVFRTLFRLGLLSTCQLEYNEVRKSDCRGPAPEDALTNDGMSGRHASSWEELDEVS